MNKSIRSKTGSGTTVDLDEIAAYSQAASPPFRGICEALREMIDAALPAATSKVWHGSPVWFIDVNPVVGYSVNKSAVSLMFWNGQSLDEPRLQPVGKFCAAQALFVDANEVDPKVVRRWLKKAKSNVFDSRGFFKKLREGR